MERTQESQVGGRQTRSRSLVFLEDVPPTTRIVFPRTGSTGIVKGRLDDGDVDVCLDGVGDATFNAMTLVQIDSDFPDLPLAGGVH